VSVVCCIDHSVIVRGVTESSSRSHIGASPGVESLPRRESRTVCESSFPWACRIHRFTRRRRSPSRSRAWTFVSRRRAHRAWIDESLLQGKMMSYFDPHLRASPRQSGTVLHSVERTRRQALHLRSKYLVREIGDLRRSVSYKDHE